MEGKIKKITALEKENCQLKNELNAEQNVRRQTETERDNWRVRAEQAEAKNNNHHCPVNPPYASTVPTQTTTETNNEWENKYQQEKTRADNLQNQLSTIHEQTQQQITQQLNNELGLGLGADINLNQVINRVKELINGGGSSSWSGGGSSGFYGSYDNTSANLQNELNQAHQTIKILQSQLNNSDTPFGEDLAVIKQLELESLEQLFPQQLDNWVREQIEQATNYQQVANARQEFLQQHLGKKHNVQLFADY